MFFFKVQSSLRFILRFDCIAPDWIKIESTCRQSPWFTQFSSSDGDLVWSGSIRCLFQEHGGQVIKPLFQLQICSTVKFTNHTFLFVCWFVHLWYLIIDTCSQNLHILIPQSIHLNFLVVFNYMFKMSTTKVCTISLIIYWYALLT